MTRGRWIDEHLDFGWTSQKIAAPVIHQGTLHGYALPDRDIYVKAAAERDWELIFAMYHRQIPPYAR